MKVYQAQKRQLGWQHISQRDEQTLQSSTSRPRSFSTRAFSKYSISLKGKKIENPGPVPPTDENNVLASSISERRSPDRLEERIEDSPVPPK